MNCKNCGLPTTSKYGYCKRTPECHSGYNNAQYRERNPVQRRCLNCGGCMRSGSKSDYCMKWEDCRELNAKAKKDTYRISPEAKERYARQVRERGAWFRSIVDIWKVQQGCARCRHRSDDPSEFEMDHLDPATKVIGVSDLCGRLNKNRPEHVERFIEEMNKCQVLCRACHIKKTRDENRKYR